MRPGIATLTAIMALIVHAAPAVAADPFLRRTAAVQAAERVGPAVVSVTTETDLRQRSPFEGFHGDPFFERYFQDFFEPGRHRTAQSLGSGVIIDDAGHVLTNEHVIARASRIKVSLSDGREFDAKLVGADPNNDIAVLRIETQEKMPWVAPGGSEDLLVGDPVLTSGLDGMFPRSTPIGRIVMVDKRGQGLFQYATVEPAVDFDRLEEVLVARGQVERMVEPPAPPPDEGVSEEAVSQEAVPFGPEPPPGEPAPVPYGPEPPPSGAPAPRGDGRRPGEGAAAPPTAPAAAR